MGRVGADKGGYRIALDAADAENRLEVGFPTKAHDTMLSEVSED